MTRATFLLHDHLIDAARRRPDKVAVVCKHERVTYRELDERSNRLAHRLIRDGVAPGSMVAVGVPRSLEWVQAVWAVAKTGAAFLSLDPAHPIDMVPRVLFGHDREPAQLVERHRHAILPYVEAGSLDALRVPRAVLHGGLQQTGELPRLQ